MSFFVIELERRKNRKVSANRHVIIWNISHCFDNKFIFVYYLLLWVIIPLQAILFCISNLYKWHLFEAIQFMYKHTKGILRDCPHISYHR